MHIKMKKDLSSKSNEKPGWDKIKDRPALWQQSANL
jgi:hypothetical protein